MPEPVHALYARWLWCGPGRLRRDAWVVVEAGRVREVCGRPPPEALRHDPGPGLVLPGLVNAHTHLELSFLAGAVPPRGDFITWVRGLISSRPGYDRDKARRAAREAARLSARRGVALVGDISNTGRAAWAWQEAGVSALTFIEAVGPARSQPPPPCARWERGVLVATGVAAHAPYSVPAPRLQALKRLAGATVMSIHLAETRAEVEFFRGRGAEGRRMEEFLEERGMRRAELELAADTPLGHLLALGVVDRRTLLVHGVQLTPAELEQVAATGASICPCPRSNLALTGCTLEVPAALAAGVNLALGSDSLASAPDLDMWQEIRELTRLYPSLDPEAVLTMATLGGARALGWGEHFGRIAPGRVAVLAFAPLEGVGRREVLEAAACGQAAGPHRGLAFPPAAEPLEASAPMR